MTSTLHEAGSKVLILTPADPQSNGIGALFLRALVAGAPDTDFEFAFQPPFLSGSRRWPDGRLVRLARTAILGLKALQGVRLGLFRACALKHQIRVVEAHARSVGADRIVVPASSPEVIWIAERLAASGWDVPVIVLDAPEYLAKNLGLSGSLNRRLMKSFANLLSSARALAVVSTAMRDAYRPINGREPVVMFHGIDIAEPLTGPRDPDRLKIVFAGSLYSKPEWNAFIAALDAAEWVLAGRPVEVHFVGRFPLRDATRSLHVVYHDEKPFEETLAFMSAMDIGYLPYWFDRSYEIVARTSFPGKMSAYAAAGLAVFHHAPAYTEAAGFLRSHPFGLTCSSLDPGDIQAALERLAAYASSPRCREARMIAFREELSSRAMASRIISFLNCQNQEGTAEEPHITGTSAPNFTSIQPVQISGANPA